MNLRGDLETTPFRVISALNLAVRPLFKISGFAKGVKISIYWEEHEILSGRNLASEKIGEFCLI